MKPTTILSHIERLTYLRQQQQEATDKTSKIIDAILDGLYEELKIQLKRAEPNGK